MKLIQIYALMLSRSFIDNLIILMPYFILSYNFPTRKSEVKLAHFSPLDLNVKRNHHSLILFENRTFKRYIMNII